MTLLGLMLTKTYKGACLVAMQKEWSTIAKSRSGAVMPSPTLPSDMTDEFAAAADAREVASQGGGGAGTAATTRETAAESEAAPTNDCAAGGPATEATGRGGRKRKPNSLVGSAYTDPLAGASCASPKKRKKKRKCRRAT